MAVVLSLILGSKYSAVETTESPVETTNKAPVISSLSASSPVVAPGRSTIITCVATDPEGVWVRYSWSAENGTITGVGGRVTWTAPNSYGIFRINVCASDEEGNKDCGGLELEVEPLEVPLKPRYFLANHGFAGAEESIDLSKFAGFETVRTIDDLASFVWQNVPHAIGFTVHPDFESGSARYAYAVIWYLGRSGVGSSWPLHLFDVNEAQKGPEPPFR